MIALTEDADHNSVCDGILVMSVTFVRNGKVGLHCKKKRRLKNGKKVQEFATNNKPFKPFLKNEEPSNLPLLEP